ncbi:hypothetical protein LJC59_06470 [Desulfovibrio sp. OttesenSCG-928-A18]|nr:hypothetical protein [Desulfovibrio sp. OttesenSCG-928-A18]
MNTPMNSILPAAEAAYSPKGERLCRLCSEAGPGCCRTDPALTHLCFPLSAPEWRRILPYAALATEAPEAQRDLFLREEAALAAFKEPPCAPGAEQDPAEKLLPPAQGDAVCAPEDNTPDFIDSMRALFPGKKSRIEELFPLGQRHHALRTRRDGSCAFLSTSGCRLPRRVRPWYCLIFPAWILRGSLALFLPPDCFIGQRAGDPVQGLALMESSAQQIKEYFSALCRDWGLKE